MDSLESSVVKSKLDYTHPQNGTPTSDSDDVDSVDNNLQVRMFTINIFTVDLVLLHLSLTANQNSPLFVQNSNDILDGDKSRLPSKFEQIVRLFFDATAANLI